MQQTVAGQLMVARKELLLGHKWLLSNELMLSNIHAIHGAQTFDEKRMVMKQQAVLANNDSWAIKTSARERMICMPLASSYCRVSDGCWITACSETTDCC